MRIPWTEEPGRLQSMGSQSVGHNWVTFTFGRYMYTLLYIKWITNKGLLYSTGNSAQCYVAVWWEGSLGEKGYMYVYVWLLMLSTWNNHNIVNHLSVQFSSVTQSCPTLRDPVNRSTPGLPVHHQLLEFTQTHVHRVSDAIQPSHPLLSPFPPARNPSQHQSLFQWVNSLHEVAKVLEFRKKHRSLIFYKWYDPIHPWKLLILDCVVSPAKPPKSTTFSLSA